MENQRHYRHYRGRTGPIHSLPSALQDPSGVQQSWAAPAQCPQGQGQVTGTARGQDSGSPTALLGTGGSDPTLPAGRRQPESHSCSALLLKKSRRKKRAQLRKSLVSRKVSLGSSCSGTGCHGDAGRSDGTAPRLLPCSEPTRTVPMR